jgi:hypothetical protein
MTDTDHPAFTDDQFAALLRLKMCADPTPLTSEEGDAVDAMLDAAAEARGHDGWVAAYHAMVEAGDPAPTMDGHDPATDTPGMEWPVPLPVVHPVHGYRPPAARTAPEGQALDVDPAWSPDWNTLGLRMSWDEVTEAALKRALIAVRQWNAAEDDGAPE